MIPSLLRILFLAGIVWCASGLGGNNVCFEQQNYSLTTRVKYQQPVKVRTYIWCMSIPPRCSKVHTEMREKWKVQTVQQSKTVEVCCEGFTEEEDACIPKCGAGRTGDDCDKDCPYDRWGASCSQECKCPENSQCDARNGKCICLDGWIGSNCNIPRDSLRKTTPMYSIPYTSKGTKSLFDWSTPIQAVTIRPIQENKNGFSSSTARSIINVVTTTRPTTRSLYTTRIAPKYTATSEGYFNLTSREVTSTRKSIKITEGTTAPQIITTTSSRPPTRYTSTLPRTTTTTTTTMSTRTMTTSSAPMIQIKTNVTPFPRLDKITPLVVTTTENSSNNTKNSIVTDSVMPKYIPTSQIESPNVTEISQTDSPVVLKTQNATLDATEISVPYTTSKTTVSTAKRKQSKIYRVESDILNITLHSASSNVTNSKIFKTVTLPSVNNATRKTIPQKGKYFHESKMITIPVRVIMDSGKVQPSVFSRKHNSTIKIEGATDAPEKRPKSQSKPENIISNVTASIDHQTEETKHVLTEPEQITSVAGSEESDERRGSFFSVLSITAGVTVAFILTAIIILLAARCSIRRRHSKREKHLEMDHVQSMMNVSEDDLSTGYLRNVFQSPLPDPPTSNADKTRFSVPFMQPVIIHAISPAMIENFRDILECHYDHPKPPRPTSFSPIKSNHLAPSVYSNVNTLPRISEGSNHSSGSEHKAEFCLPVTDEAINVLKMEHQNAQQHSLNMENLDPVYDEIPCWHPIPVCANQVLQIGDEAVTEL